MRRQLPGSIAVSLRILFALVVLSALAVVLTWLQLDKVIRAWAEGNPSAQEILASGGMAALREEVIVPKFVPLAVVSFVVFVALVVVLVAFLVDGHGWSRVVITSLCFFGMLVSVLGLNHDLPIGFVVISVLSFVLYAALVFFLWRKDTSTYLRVN